MNRNKALTVLPLLGLALLLALSPHAQSGSDAATLDKLAWMAGAWGGTESGVEMEEHWLAPRGGLLLGLHRDVFPNGRAFFEYLRIEQSADGITYWASPLGRPATPFRLKELGDKRVVFENPEHDWPQRILYWRGDDGALHARVEGDQNGQQRAEEWRWTPLSKK